MTLIRDTRGSRCAFRIVLGAGYVMTLPALTIRHEG